MNVNKRTERNNTAADATGEAADKKEREPLKWKKARQKKKANKLKDKLKQQRHAAYLEQEMSTEMNVALKLKEEEAKRETDKAVKTADQKIIEMKNAFWEKTRKERRALSEKQKKKQ